MQPFRLQRLDLNWIISSHYQINLLVQITSNIRKVKCLKINLICVNLSINSLYNGNIKNVVTRHSMYLHGRAEVNFFISSPWFSTLVFCHNRPSWSRDISHIQFCSLAILQFHSQKSLLAQFLSMTDLDFNTVLILLHSQGCQLGNNEIPHLD